MVADYFDDHLALLIEVLYQFCGLEDREPCIDPLTVYLFHQLRTWTRICATISRWSTSTA